MAATVELDELNLSGTTTHGITNMNVGSFDQPNLQVNPTTAIVQGKNSFIKYNKLHFTAFNTVSTIQNIRTWMVGTIGTESTMYTGGGAYAQATFATPTQAALVPSYYYPTSAPTGPNIGIGGSVNGSLTAPGQSDLWAWQVQLPLTQAYGYIPTKTFYFSWDES